MYQFGVFLEYLATAAFCLCVIACFATAGNEGGMEEKVYMTCFVVAVVLGILGEMLKKASQQTPPR